jgi:hypothetical protein
MVESPISTDFEFHVLQGSDLHVYLLSGCWVTTILLAAGNESAMNPTGRPRLQRLSTGRGFEPRQSPSWNSLKSREDLLILPLWFLALIHSSMLQRGVPKLQLLATLGYLVSGFILTGERG